MLVDAISPAITLLYVPKGEGKLEGWEEDAATLKRVFDARIAKSGLTQESFGGEYGIGNQAMVWQYLNAKRPLNIWAAAKFAKGLQSTITDIAPNLAGKLREEVLPYLGPARKRRLPEPVPAEARGVVHVRRAKRTAG